jgi:hypothetical protein
MSRGGELTAACDMYGFGGILFFVASGQAPWARFAVPDVFAAVLARRLPAMPSLADGRVAAAFLSGMPAGVETLLITCLANDPSQRPSSRRVVEILSEVVAPL